MQRIIIGREYPQVAGELVQEAKRSIKILIYDWRWYKNEIGTKIQKFNQELLKSANSGVSVEALVNIDVIKSQFQNEKIKIKRIDTSRTMHAKMIIFDEKKVLLGSHNLTKNAFEINWEISVLVDEPEAVAKCLDFYNRLNK